MGIGTIKIGNDGRKKLLKLLTYLNTIQFILGFTTTVIGCLMFFTIANNLHTSNKHHSSILSIYISMMGLMTILVAIIGLRMARNCASKPPLKDIDHFHSIWMLITIVLITLIISILFTLSEVYETILHILSDTFLHGILNYMTDISWKKMFDYFQTHLKCCGVNKYSDWYETPWVSLSHLPQDANTLSKFGRADGQVLVSIVPNSCCKPNKTESQCNMDVIEKLTTNIPPVSTTNIHTTGCIPVLRNMYARIIIVVAILGVFICFVQLAITAAGHYLYTSTRNCLLMGTPHSAAPGWLFGRGDCGFIGDASLIANKEITANTEETEGKTTELGNKLNIIKKKLHINTKHRCKECESDSSIEDESSIKTRIKKRFSKLRNDKNKNQKEEMMNLMKNED